MNRIVLGLSVAVGVSIATSASAWVPAAPRTHDRFYLQATTGFGYLTTSNSDLGRDQSVSGMTWSTSLQLGTSLMPGLALGGGFLVDYSFSPTTKWNGVEVANSPIASQYALGIGPFVDYYPNPTGGLHFQGMVGWGRLNSNGNGDVSIDSPSGLMFLVGGGHDWWIADQWSVGVLGRIAIAPMWYEGVSYVTIAPAVLATVTYY